MAAGNFVLADPLPLARFGREALAWPDGEPFELALLTALVVPYLDGTVPLEELVEDAASVLDEPISSATSTVLADLDELARRGAVRSGPTNGHAVSVARAEAEALDPDGVRVLEVVEEGNQTVTLEQLPDGRFRRTVVASLDAASSSDQLRDALTTNALSDIVGGDTCVGFKIRAGERAHDLVVDVDGHRTRVRVDHEPTLTALRSRLGSSIAVDEELAVGSGALSVGDPGAENIRSGLGVTAYVIGPLDGAGPPRIYDRWGRRIGRPESGESAAAIVGHMLNGERPVRAAQGLVVHAFPVVVPNGCVLLVEPLRDVPQLHRALRIRGFEPVDCPRVRLTFDGRAAVESPYPWSDERVLPIRGLVGIGSERSPAISVAKAFLNGVVAPGPAAAQRALSVLSGLVSEVPLEVLSHGDHRHVTAVVEAMANASPGWAEGQNST